MTPRATEAVRDVMDRKYVPFRLFESSQTRETARYSVFKDRAKPVGTCVEPLGRTRNPHPEPCGMLLISRSADSTVGAYPGQGQTTAGFALRRPRPAGPHAPGTRAELSLQPDPGKTAFPYLDLVGARRQSPSHGLTTPVDRFCGATR